ncbi:SHOCT domain-containing protein [Acetobacterium wieringae]|uniref:SHOCT domain-containing protein n=1 Tax=Acetobacterium wieringae TaxID=52694 RepID=UPI002B20CD22|nr:SHOCT domain-containing protein [Acetobacterium wieringae]MEA4805536.1 SHOCT domain-containing protein [Acetobacterium wieringae]
MAGLLRGVARTAVVAGTATAVSNRVSRRQAQHFAEKDQQAYAQQQQAYQQQQVSQQHNYQEDVDFDEQLAQLAKLGQLRDQGILTQQEFEAKKRQILGV